MEQRVVAIEGDARQDMTWPAQEAYEEALKSDPPWKKVVPLSAAGALETILSVAGWGPAYRTLRAHGIVVSGTPLLRYLAIIVPLVSLGMFCAAVSLAVACGKAASMVYVLSLAMVALSALGWRLGSSAIRTRMARRLAAALADPSLDQDAASAAGRSLGSGLVRTQSVMILVVDDYHRLPLPAREAIIEALCEQRLESAITWIVFDSSPARPLAADLARIKADNRAAVVVTAYKMHPA